MGSDKCPSCGREYDRLAQHWAMSAACSYPTIPEPIHKMLTGLLMGDGTVQEAKSAANPRIEIHNINHSFLSWIDEQFEWLSTGVTLRRTSDDIYETNRGSSLERFASCEYSVRDQYILTTRRHPELERYVKWYDTGQKRFPRDLVLTPTILKLWYVCDGHLIWGSGGHVRPQVWVSAENERDRITYIRELFEQTPISPSFRDGRLMLTSDETEWFFEYIGRPVPGSEYKFVTESKEQYEKTKEAFYWRHTTTNST